MNQNGGITTSRELRKETGYAFFITVLRILYGVTVFNAGISHLQGGLAGFVASLMSQGTAIGTWVAANAGFMFWLVVIGMFLTGISLIFGILARLGSIALFLFAFFFILGMNSWVGNLAMLGVSIGFIIIGPGRYFGIDSYLLERKLPVRFLA